MSEQEQPNQQSEAAPPPTEGAPVSAAPQDPAARIAQLEQELAKEQDRATEYMKNWQRAAADLSNFRRRAQQDRDELVRFGDTLLLADMLPALDAFDRAWRTLPKSLAGFSWIMGVRLVEAQMRGLLERRGCTAIHAVGEKFDPNLHEAVQHAERSDAEEGTVVEVLQEGWKLPDQLLRPALVIVARQPAAPAETAQAPEAGIGPADEAAVEPPSNEAPEGEPGPGNGPSPDAPEP